MYEGIGCARRPSVPWTKPRAAVTALTTPADEQLSQALPRRIAEVADRYGISLYWSLAHDVDMSASNREQISRIVREAVINAARHGAATSVHVRLDVSELGRVR